MKRIYIYVITAFALLAGACSDNNLNDDAPVVPATPDIVIPEGAAEGDVSGGAATAVAPARKLSPHVLWTLGQTPRWQAGEPARGNADEARDCETVKNRETLSSTRETSMYGRETIRSEE